jgi:hypothetical protein
MVERNLVPEEIGMVFFQESLLIPGKRNEGNPLATTAFQLNPLFSYLRDQVPAKTA